MSDLPPTILRGRQALPILVVGCSATWRKKLIDRSIDESFGLMISDTSDRSVHGDHLTVADRGLSKEDALRFAARIALLDSRARQRELKGMDAAAAGDPESEVFSRLVRALVNQFEKYDDIEKVRRYTRA